MSIKPIFELVDETKRDLENLSIEQLKNEMAKRDDLLLIDIRELQENVDLGTIPGARHAPRGMLEFWADPASPYYRDYFAEDRRIVLFCAGGGRSALAAKALKDMGYPDVAHLAAGFNGWAKAGESVQETASASRWMRKPADRSANVPPKG
ncbi:MAG: rhodanese-like domain-containing protein [Gammaproteobacteria bacterium]|nr:rhodanese-like domain-containing protein [Gammaproteobacteria bacterium]MDE0364893.1 rhodanese-like domain-containing protein [Gammaproteobacteria bacterium]